MRATPNNCAAAILRPSGESDVEAMSAYLRTKGVEVDEPEIAPFGMKQMYLRDPDGYGICFQWPEAVTGLHP